MCLWQKARALSPFWFKGTDLEMARHTSSWECDSQQMACAIKLDRPLSIKERRLYLCYKQFSHYGCIKTIWCSDIAQSWKRQKCIFWYIFCISHQVKQAWLYAESLDSHPFISCGKKEYWDTGIDSAQRRFQTSSRKLLGCTWVTKIKELFDKVVVCL